MNMVSVREPNAHEAVQFASPTNFFFIHLSYHLQNNSTVNFNCIIAKSYNYKTNRIQDIFNLNLTTAMT